MPHKITLGTRNSKMAGIVAEKAKQMIENSHSNCEVEIKQHASFGDKFQGDLKQKGGKGAFVNDLERRLLNHEIDCAIHAVKDIPADCLPNPDLKLFSFLPRTEVRDALITRPGIDTPQIGQDSSHLTFGTSSPRRNCMLKQLYPSCTVKPLRGNADTRLKRVLDGDFDAIILSYAGLQYLNLTEHVAHVYEPEEMLPAVGQGALVLQVRTEDAQKCTFLKEINSEESEKSILAERAMLSALNGNCHSAIAGYYRRSNSGYLMDGFVGLENEAKSIQLQKELPFEHNPEHIGKILADDLIAKGAKDFIKAA